MNYLTNIFKPLLLLFSLLIISACSNPSVNDYVNTSPSFDVLDFFSGELEAKGVVADRSGLVSRRFSVQMLGSLEKDLASGNDILTLKEWFDFDDGEKMQRTWVITKEDDGLYTGTAGDIIGTAKGESKGMALRWDYQMNLSVDGNTYKVVFDDWLYQIDAHNVINRSVIKKWGINVGEVILSIRKI